MCLLGKSFAPVPATVPLVPYDVTELLLQSVDPSQYGMQCPLLRPGWRVVRLWPSVTPQVRLQLQVLLHPCPAQQLFAIQCGGHQQVWLQGGSEQFVILIRQPGLSQER